MLIVIRRFAKYLPFVLLIAYNHYIYGGPQNWSGYLQTDGVGWEGQGADIAFANLDGDARPDMILMAYDNPPKANNFRYKIGWNVNNSGAAKSWTAYKQVGGVGEEGQGAGIAFVNLDSNTRPEMILMAYDNPAGANNFRYRIGWNINTNGDATSWSTAKEVSGVGSEGQGASTVVGNIDNDPRPDMVLIAYDNPPKANQFRMRFGWNLDGNGNAKSWTDWRKVAGMGDEGQGAGAALLNLNSNPRPDLVLLAYDNPSGANSFRYRVAYDLDTNGVPVAWSPYARVDGVGWEGQGAGVAFANLDSNPRQEMVVMAYDNPPKANSFRYRIGWNWDSNPPQLRLIHTPLHPGKNEKVTFTATASDPDGLKNIEILVNAKLVKTCMKSPCTYTGGPYPNYEGTAVAYGANAYDTSGSRAWTGYRAFAVGNYPSKAVPIWVHGSPDQKIDVVFIRDADSYSGSLRTCKLPDGTIYTCGGGEARFLQDIADTIRNSYLADELIGANIYRFNFWYFKDTGTTDSCNNNPPSSYFTDAAFADSGAIIHADPFRDCATGGVFSSEPTSYRTFVHESGHAIFGLADEYCCDGGYWQPDPWPNLYTSLGNCQTDATQQGWPTGDCKSITRTIDGTKFWLSDRNDLMDGCVGGFPSCAPGDFDFDRGCRRRAVWVLDKLP